MVKALFLIASGGSAHLNYFFKFLLFVKSSLIRFSSLLSSLEAILGRVYGDYRGLNRGRPVVNSNMFFYKTRNISSYFSYLSNILSYLSVLSLFSDVDHKNFLENRGLFYSYFAMLSNSSLAGVSSRTITNTLDVSVLEKIYLRNDIPNLNELNSHLLGFFVRLLRSKFSFGNSLSMTFNKLSFIKPSGPRSIYSFVDAQAYTAHNTKLEIVWTVIPTIVLILIAIPSFILLYSLDEVINPSITLKAIGHQWYWSYEYSDYTEENSINFDSYMINEGDLQLGQFRLLEVDNRVVLPVNTHIRVLITAGDVLHA